MEHRQIYPQPGWVEHDPLEIWRNTQAVIAEALRGADLTVRDLAAIGITNQRETTLLWDRATGRAGAQRAWSGRTRASIRWWRNMRGDGGQDRFRAQTGLPLASYFSALKLRWLLDNVPERAVAPKPANWLSARSMPGCSGTSPAACHRRHQCQPHAADEPGHAGLGRALLACLRHPARGAAAHRPVRPRCMARHAALDGVPIAGILGDQQAALMGQACFAPGEAKNTYGTGCFLLMNTGETPVAVHQRPGHHCRLEARRAGPPATRWKVRSR